MIPIEKTESIFYKLNEAFADMAQLINLTIQGNEDINTIIKDVKNGG